MTMQKTDGGCGETILIALSISATIFAILWGLSFYKFLPPAPPSDYNNVPREAGGGWRTIDCTAVHETFKAYEKVYGEKPTKSHPRLVPHYGYQFDVQNKYCRFDHDYEQVFAVPQTFVDDGSAGFLVMDQDDAKRFLEEFDGRGEFDNEFEVSVPRSACKKLPCNP